MHVLPPPRLGSVRSSDIRPPSRLLVVAGLLRMAVAVSLISVIVVMLELAAASGPLQPAASLSLMENPIR